MVERMTMGVPMAAQVTLQGKPRNLSPGWETNLLRIGQEALTNALRHARASRFELLLAFERRGIRLTLKDDGCGFDPSKNHEGFGLEGMRERTEDMGGRFAIESSKGNGAVISIVLPLESLPESERL
jgi:signal transduction histidine kinase